MGRYNPCGDTLVIGRDFYKPLSVDNAGLLEHLVRVPAGTTEQTTSPRRFIVRGKLNHYM